MIDYEVIKKCDFPILKVDGFLSDLELRLCKDEIVNIESEAKYTEEEIREYDRVFLDEKYRGHREQSDILRVVSEKLFSPEMIDIYNSIKDTSFKLIEGSSRHETQLTFYSNKHSYEWHTDAMLNRVINWVLYIDIDGDFTGGENQISNDDFNEGERNHPYNVYISTPPKDNMLIMMPSWITHRVAPVFCKHKSKLRSRITINGHIGFAQ